MKSLVKHGHEFGLYFNCSAKPLKGFKITSIQLSSYASDMFPLAGEWGRHEWTSRQMD
jgi:hypothetical protein